MVFLPNFMYQKRKILKVKNKFFVFYLFSLCAFTNTNGQGNLYVSYQNFILNVRANNPIALKSANYGDLANRQYKAALGNFDPSINASTENKFFNSTGYYNLFQGEITQPLFTSQKLKIGYEYGTGNFINPEQYTSSYGLPYIGLEVGLLQGLVIDKRRAELLKSINYIEYYKAEEKIILNDVLFESAQSYFEWLFAKKQFSLQSYFLTLANQRLKVSRNSLYTEKNRVLIQ